MGTLKSPFHVVAVTVVLLSAITALFLVSCGGDDEGDNASPEIVGCNSVSYRGLTWAMGCAPGIVSFDQTTNQAGVTVSFRVTCSGGCVSAVEVLSGNTTSIVSP